MAASLYIKSTLAAVALVAAANTACAQTSKESLARDSAATIADKAAIEAVMSKYQAALNASNTNLVMPLYAEDGVFMPPYSHSAIGKAAVREAYDAVFKAITLHVKFQVAELVQMAPDWAFVRTNSAGTNTVNATGAQNAEGNQELFIFRKGTDGAWKIARYSFSSTNPPPSR